jgi:hypothetical protein
MEYERLDAASGQGGPLRRSAIRKYVRVLSLGIYDSETLVSRTANVSREEQRGHPTTMGGCGMRF